MMSIVRRGTSVNLLVAVLASVGLGLLVMSALGHDGEGTKAKTVLRQTLQEKMDGKNARVTLLEINYAPGEETGPHRHPGPAIVYVLEGSVVMQVDGQKPKTLHKGETFYEPARALHLVSRNASRTAPARFLAFLMSTEDDKNLVLPPR